MHGTDLFDQVLSKIRSEYLVSEVTSRLDDFATQQGSAWTATIKTGVVEKSQVLTVIMYQKNAGWTVTAESDGSRKTWTAFTPGDLVETIYGVATRLA